MGSQYKQVTLENANPGMVLSDDVLDMHGHVLLAKGITLTETILASLRRHQVALLPVASEEISQNGQETEISRHEERLKRLFRKPCTGSDDATDLLEQHVRQFRLGDSA